MNKDYLKTWQKLLKADNLTEALCDHFNYLTDKEVPGFEPLLKTVMQEVTGVQIKDNMLVLEFPNDESIEASPPCPNTEEKYADWPEGFRLLMKRHESLRMTNKILTLADHGGYDEYWTQELPWDHEEIRSPIADDNNIWIYHPEQRNSWGEPVIYFLSHEQEMDNPQYYNAGGLFLIKIVNWLDPEMKIPSGIADKEAKLWWNTLDDAWKKMVGAVTNETGLDAAKTMMEQKSLSINENSGITFLEPIRSLSRLETFECWEKNIQDFSPLSHLTQLTTLDLSGCNIVDISPLKQLKQLKSLDLSDTGVKDITSLGDLKALDDLRLSGTKITDLTPLSSLKKLTSLWISHTEISNLGPLLSLSKGLDINCYSTPVSFHEVLRLSEHLLEGHKGDFFTFSGSIYSDHNLSAEVFIKALEGIDFPLDGIENALIKYTNDYLLKLIKSKEQQHLVPKLLSAYLRLPVKQLSGIWAEELAGNALASITVIGLEPQMEQAILEHMIPKEIGLSRLAFNLACYYAGKNKKDLMLNYVTKALELGHERARFESDQDFAPYQNDADFQKVIKQPATPGPETDPLGWFNILPEQLKQDILWQGELYEITEPSAEQVRSIIESEDFSVSLESPESLDYLHQLKHLKKLIILFSKAQSLEVVATLSSLELFECNYEEDISKVRYKDLAVFSGLRRLEVLEFEDNAVEDISPLAQVTSLKELNLLGNPLQSLAPLQNLVHLKKFRCSLKVPLQTAIFKPFTMLSLLQLNMEKNTIDSFDGFALAENLEVLKIRNAQPASGEAFSMKPLLSLKNLKELHLLNTPVTDLEALFSVTSLKKLIVDEKYADNDLKDQFRKHLPECTVRGW